MRKGIDISSHQGDINFDYIKDNYAVYGRG